MPDYIDYNLSVRNVIDEAIRNGVEAGNNLLEDLSHDELLKQNIVQLMHNQCCTALALLLSADANGDPEYAPASMRQAMLDRLCDKFRVTC